MSEKSSNFAAQNVGIKKINQDKPLWRQYAYSAPRLRPNSLLINKFNVVR